MPSYMCMGWRRFVGSLKLQISFAKEPYKRDYILQKRLMILRSLLIVATSYVSMTLKDKEPCAPIFVSIHTYIYIMYIYTHTHTHMYVDGQILE